MELTMELNRESLNEKKKIYNPSRKGLKGILPSYKNNFKRSPGYTGQEQSRGLWLASPVCFNSSLGLVSLETEDSSHFSGQLIVENFSIHVQRNANYCQL